MTRENTTKRSFYGWGQEDVTWGERYETCGQQDSDEKVGGEWEWFQIGGKNKRLKQ